MDGLILNCLKLSNITTSLIGHFIKSRGVGLVYFSRFRRSNYTTGKISSEPKDKRVLSCRSLSGSAQGAMEEGH